LPLLDEVADLVREAVLRAAALLPLPADFLARLLELFWLLGFALLRFALLCLALWLEPFEPEALPRLEPLDAAARPRLDPLDDVRDDARRDVPR